jgi:glycosyltransferase involved in cell wall biosynthesis
MTVRPGPAVHVDGRPTHHPGPSRRLMFLLPFPPRLDAAHGGGRVTAQLLAELTTYHRVALLYFRSADEPPLDEYLRAACEIVEEVRRPWGGKSFNDQCVRNGRLLLGLGHGRPMWATDWANKTYAGQVTKIAQAWQPEVVHLEYHIMGQYVDRLANCAAARILTLHEPASTAAPYLKRTYPVVNGVLNYLDRRAWQRFEPDVLRRVDATVVFTPTDEEAIKQLVTKPRIVCIPLGTPVPLRALNPLGTSPLRLLFIGNFNHPPNIEAAMRLARNIFPAAREHVADLQLDVIGSDPPPELLRLHGSGVNITGWVPDTTPHLDAAAIFVAPISSGGGMRVKVLEALAAGKAVVASGRAVDGLTVRPGQEVHIAESDEEFTARILDLLTDRRLRAAVANRARTWATAHLSWERSRLDYEALYESLLDGKNAAS